MHVLASTSLHPGPQGTRLPPVPGTAAQFGKWHVDGWIARWPRWYPLSACRSESPCHLSPFYPPEEGAELRPGTQNVRGGLRFSQSISSCCLLLCPGTRAPSRPLGLLQGHGERTVALAAFLSFPSQQKEATNPRTSQKMSLWLPEPSPRARLTWDLEASIFSPGSLSRARTLWSSGPGPRNLTSQGLCVSLCRLVARGRWDDSDI